jgi:hypothetical protein
MNRYGFEATTDVGIFFVAMSKTVLIKRHFLLIYNRKHFLNKHSLSAKIDNPTNKANKITIQKNAPAKEMRKEKTNINIIFETFTTTLNNLLVIFQIAFKMI